MSLSNQAEVDILTWYFTNDTAPTRPTAWYASLHTADPGDTGASELYTPGTNTYNRQTVTNGFSTPSGGGAIQNDGAIVWTNSSGSAWTQVTHFGVWNHATNTAAANFMGSGALSANKTIANGDTATFAIGDLDITLD